MSLKLTNLAKNFGPVEVLRDINIEIEKGDFLVLLGGSGCGKTTLLNCVAGLEETTAGRIEINGRDVTRLDPIGPQALNRRMSDLIAKADPDNPFRFYVLKRVQDEFEALAEPERRGAAELLEACGMRELLEAKLTRDIGRRNNLEVWL